MSRLFIIKLIFTNDECRQKEQIYDTISNQALNSNLEKLKKIDEFVQKGIEAHSGDDDERLLKEREKKDRLEKDTMVYREIQVSDYFSVRCD